MVRGAAIGFVVIMLLTTVVTWLMLTGAVYAQQAPRHVFSGSVLNAGDAVYEGHVSFLDMSGHEVAKGNVNNGRYKIAVLEVPGRNYSGQTFQITVRFQNRIYERAQRVNWQAGGVTTLDLEFGEGSGWRWHRAPSQNDQPPSQNDQQRMEEDRRRMEQNDEDRDRRIEMDEQRMQRENDDSARRMEMEEERMELERQRMESEDALRREQMTMQSERENKDREERREMEQQQRQQQMEQQTAREERERKDRMEMEQQRMEREDAERKERMEMERQRMGQQRMGSGQPGVQPVAGERPKSGPGRGLFSNNKAGEATSGIDNIMDPGMLTIIGIALTVLTTGMTLFKGD